MLSFLGSVKQELCHTRRKVATVVLTHLSKINDDVAICFVVFRIVKRFKFIEFGNFSDF